MKEYTYEVEHSWEKQRQPIFSDNQHRHYHHHRRRVGGEDAAMDADASNMSGKYVYLYPDALFYVYIKFRNTNTG